jgi:hypothetical protein
MPQDVNANLSHQIKKIQKKVYTRNVGGGRTD